MDIAKIFNHPSGKQIVVIRGEDNETCYPNISILVEPDGLGICAQRFTYPDTDQGYEKRDRVFTELTEKDVISAVSIILNGASAFTDLPS